MLVDLDLAPKTKRAAGEPCCEPVVYPDVERAHAIRMAAVAKALGDPIRLQLVDVLRKHAGKVCVCELVPLFDICQPTALPSPQEAARRRHRRLRAPRPVGLLLRPSRRAAGADRMAELTTPDHTGRRLLRARGPGELLRAEREGRVLRDERGGRPCGCAAGRRRRGADESARDRPRALRRRRARHDRPGRGRRLLRRRRGDHRRAGRAVRREPVRRRRARRAARHRRARLARMRQPDRGRRAARGRDRARPRLGRRHRRAALRPPRRPHRHAPTGST